MTNATTYNKPLPKPSRLSRPYWEAAKRHELVIQNCKDCSRKWMPPSNRCPSCLGMNVEWVKASGKGKVWSWVVFHQPYFAGFRDELPYNVAYVELEEGPRLLTSIVGGDLSKFVCDMPVEVVFDDVTDEITLPKFKPV